MTDMEDFNIEERSLDHIFNQISEKEQKESDNRMLLAKKLSLAMESKGWNQKILAKKMGKDEAQISRWVSGRHNITSDILFELQEALGIELVNTRIEEMQFAKNLRSYRTTRSTSAIEEGMRVAALGCVEASSYQHLPKSRAGGVIKPNETRYVWVKTDKVRSTAVKTKKGGGVWIDHNRHEKLELSQFI